MRLSTIFFSLSNSANQSFHLQVLERKSLGCFQPGESVRYLRVNQGGDIPCPGQNCSNNTDVIWYRMKHKVVWEAAGPLPKEHRAFKAKSEVSVLQRVQAVSEQLRNYCERSGQLEICWVYQSDTGVYFCDRQTTDSWIFRRAVNVIVVRKCNLSARGANKCWC